MRKLNEVFCSFNGVSGFYYVLNITPNILLRAGEMYIREAKLSKEYGDTIFIMKLTVLRDGSEMSFEDILNLEISDFNMLLKSINKQYGKIRSSFE